MTQPQSAIGLLYTTWPDTETATGAAETLLDENLIRCANILGPSQSIYVWKGETCRDSEVIALFKTSYEKAKDAQDRLSTLHPYEEPCILSLHVNAGTSAPGFINWIEHMNA